MIKYFSKFVKFYPITEIYSTLEKYASVNKFTIQTSDLDKDFLYCKCRAITADVPNSNGDYFSLEELKKSYKTFIGKGVFVNHQSNDIEKIRGKIFDARLIENPKEAYVELLIGIDKKAFPQLARAIEKRMVVDVSMGASVKYSTCSICGKTVTSEKDYCDHIKYYKGGMFNNKRVYEINKDVTFFELSLVTHGADKTAKILEIYPDVDNLKEIDDIELEQKDYTLKKVASLLQNSSFENDKDNKKIDKNIVKYLENLFYW